MSTKNVDGCYPVAILTCVAIAICTYVPVIGRAAIFPEARARARHFILVPSSCNVSVVLLKSTYFLRKPFLLSFPPSNNCLHGGRSTTKREAARPHNRRFFGHEFAFLGHAYFRSVVRLCMHASLSLVVCGRQPYTTLSGKVNGV